jgi:hypothetical protein
MSSKFVRFNYFEVQLIPAITEIRRELLGEENVEELPYHAEDWDMSGILDYITEGNMASTNVPLGDEFVEVEPGSLTIPDNNIRSFQLTKLRDTNIPAKKRMGEIRQEIQLQDDEYIGEFVSIIYDNRYKVLMVQSNRYGLTVKQIENYLTDLRLRYLQAIGHTEEMPSVVKLSPIIDLEMAQNVLNADYFRKIHIRGADFMEDAQLNQYGLLSTARRLLFQSCGVYFEITLSLGRATPTATLDHELVREMVEEYSRLNVGKPIIEITKKDDELADTEIVNLINPRLTDRIVIEIEPRTTVAHEFLYHRMREIYEHRRPVIARILVPTV